MIEMCSENKSSEDLPNLTEHFQNTDLLPISPTIKKKRHKINWNVKQIHEEREKKALFLLNYEERKTSWLLCLEGKKSVGEVKPVELETDNVLPIQTVANCTRIFDTELFGRYYYYDSSNTMLKAVSDIEDSCLLLNIKSEIVLFKIMATSPDKQCVKKCYNKLILANFNVSLKDVVMAFLNWGATADALGGICENHTPDRIKRKKYSGIVYQHNVEYVLLYIKGLQTWTSDEICSLVVILISAAVDKTMLKLSKIFISVLLSLINKLEEEYIHQCACKIIERFKTMEVLSAVYVCTVLMPVCVKGNTLSVEISFGLLRILLNSDSVITDVESVMNALLKDEKPPEYYFQNLYHPIRLVENICVKRYDKKQPISLQMENLGRLNQSVMDVIANIKYTDKKGYEENAILVKDLLIKLSHHIHKLNMKLETFNHFRNQYKK